MKIGVWHAPYRSVLIAEPMTETTTSIALPWGPDETLALMLPPAWPPADVVRPDLEGVLTDYPAALASALDAPAGCGRIEDLVRAGSKVALVVDDPSRWTPVREALPLILERLH